MAAAAAVLRCSAHVQPPGLHILSFASTGKKIHLFSILAIHPCTSI